MESLEVYLGLVVPTREASGCKYCPQRAIRGGLLLLGQAGAGLLEAGEAMREAKGIASMPKGGWKGDILKAGPGSFWGVSGSPMR